MVIPRGFEPAVTGLRGRRPRPLDEGTIFIFIFDLYKYYTIFFYKNQIKDAGTRPCGYQGAYLEDTRRRGFGTRHKNFCPEWGFEPQFLSLRDNVFTNLTISEVYLLYVSLKRG